MFFTLVSCVWSFLCSVAYVLDFGAAFCVFVIMKLTSGELVKGYVSLLIHVMLLGAVLWLFHIKLYTAPLLYSYTSPYTMPALSHTTLAHSFITTTTTTTPTHTFPPLTLFHLYYHTTIRTPHHREQGHIKLKVRRQTVLQDSMDAIESINAADMRKTFRYVG